MSGILWCSGEPGVDVAFGAKTVLTCCDGVCSCEVDR